MSDTTIEWCARTGTKPKTWNPTRGCSIISPGCARCYAMRQAHRHSAPSRPYAGLTVLTGAGPVWIGEVREVPEMLGVPLSWRSPCTVFVNSMSDLFHEAVRDEFIAAVFAVMAGCPRHTFIILTKRARRMREWFAGAGKLTLDDLRGYARNHGVSPARGTTWPLPNVWLLVSAEDQQRADERIPELLRTPAVVRGVSAEPLLEVIDIHRWVNLTVARHYQEALLDWVIVGGESGSNARPFEVGWARSILAECKFAGVPCFVKQLGAEPRGKPGECTLIGLKDRKGGDPAEWPEDLRVREFPEVRS